MCVKYKQAGFSLIEVIIVVLIVLLLSVVALPYYQSAVEATRMTEATLLWGHLKRHASDQDLSSKQHRIEQEANQKRLKYFTFQLECRPFETPQKEEGEEEKVKKFSSDGTPCWEAVFSLQKPEQSIRYYLTTQHNFNQLLCVPLNRAGESFCQSQAAKGYEEKISFQEKDAYLLHH